MTGDWGPIGSFKVGNDCQKDHGVTSGDREELEMELITDHAYVMKPPSALLKRIESFWTGEHVRMLGG